MEQLPLPFLHPSHGEEDNFIVTPSNRLAHDFIATWPHWPVLGGIIQGPRYSGKTHLARLWQRKASAQFFTREEARAWESQEIPASPLICIVDSLEDFLSENETALFHLFNRVKESGGFLLLTTESPIKALPLKLPDLISRLSLLPIFSIEEPDDALFLAILAKRFSDEQLMVDPKILEFLVKHVPRTFESLKTLPHLLSAAALEEHHALTIPFVKRTLSL